MRLDTEQAWQDIRQNALGALESHEVYASQKRGQRYRVSSVSENSITITRLDAAAPETLRRADVARAVNRLNAAGGRVPRQSLNYTVAKEVAIVQFHPRLRWDATQDNIEVVSEEANEDNTFISSSSPHFWAFVATPRIYRIEDVVREKEFDTWRVRSSDVRPGDRVLIWKAKGNEDKRGIIAFAEVMAGPTLRPSLHPEYFGNATDGTTPAMRVEIRYVRLPHLPLWHDENPNSPLSQLTCCRATGGTLFKVSAAEWDAIVALAGSWLKADATIAGNPQQAQEISGRNPAWARDELLLALDLYFRQNPAHISETHPDVVELSETLRSLPIHSCRPDPMRFRNPNGVYMKLCNFLRFDPAYSGSGLKAGAKAEEAIWNEFAHDQQRLRQLADAIRSGAAELNAQAEPLPSDTEGDENIEVAEGRVLLKLHKVRERNPTLVQKRKAQALRQQRRLACEVCGFDFQAVYGAVGTGYIECHHTRPISQMQPGETTRLEHLALVCSNCHRMLHRGGETLTIEQLRNAIQSIHTE